MNTINFIVVVSVFVVIAGSFGLSNVNGWDASQDLPLSREEIQSYVNGEFETILNYCVEHAGDKLNPLQELLGQKLNPVQDLVNKGLVAQHFNDDSCQSVKGAYDIMRLYPMQKYLDALK